MREKFKPVKTSGNIKVSMDAAKGVWKASKAKVLANIVKICSEYMEEGYTLTLRQLYYQLVARDLIPNHDKVYKKISSLKDDAVYSGLIDWNVFEDRGRVPWTPYWEDGVAEALQKTVEYYRLDRQRNQNVHIEVWTEKDAISSILKRVTNYYGVTLVVNKGYTSSTAIYGAYSRFIEVFENGGKVKILYFGDHDPSGLDMIRDIEERLMFMFCNGTKFNDAFCEDYIMDWWTESDNDLHDISYLETKYEDVWMLLHQERLTDSKIDKLYDLLEEGRKKMFIQDKGLFEVQQVGLTMQQIKQYNPPSNPAKMTDPRMSGYISKYGKVSWEVDALKPKVMESIVKTAIEANIDLEAFKELIEEEKADRAKIKDIINDL